MYIQKEKSKQRRKYGKNKWRKPWYCTHTHTPGILVNKKIINRINKIKKDSKNLVLIDDTGWVCYLFVHLKIIIDWILESQK